MTPARKLLALASLTALTVAMWPAIASAHVTIENDQVAAGSFAILHFQAPNESESANTVKLEIGIPTDVTIPFVAPRTMPGWQVTTETRKLDQPVQTDDGTVDEVVSKVTYEGGSIPPGQFQGFDLEVGPLPDTPGAVLAFPAIQTYDDGTVVRWIDPVKDGEPEPEHPAPRLTLIAADSAAAGSGSSNGSDNDTTLAIIALVLGAIGTIAGVTGVVLARRRA
jgi:uncharacterized protein YcnI